MAGHNLSLTWLHIVLHSIIGIALALLLWSSGLLNGIEDRTYDLRASFFAKPSLANHSIVLILVDQNSLNWVSKNMGISWPWPRELYGAIIDNCNRRGAKAIGFDVLFTESSKYGVEDDSRLRTAISQNDNFALGSVFPSAISGPYSSWPVDIPRPSFKINSTTFVQPPVFSRATFPIAELVSSGMVLSNVHHDPDQDGIYRKIHPFVLFDGSPLPALGIGVYLTAHHGAVIRYRDHLFEVDGHRIPLDRKGNALLNFRGPSGTYQAFSAASIIENEFTLKNNGAPQKHIARDLSGKYILFGFSAPGLHDLRPSPTDGIFSGVEINATILDNLLSDDFIRPVADQWTVLVICFLTAFASCMVAVFSALRIQAVAAFLLMLLPSAVALSLFNLGYDFKWVPLQVGVTAGVVLTIFQRYFIVGRQEKFIKNSFKHYLSPDVIEQLIAHPERLKLGGERKEMTFFFSDLEGFTSISEGLEPEKLTALLNDYLSAMTDIIQQGHGTVDKFEGDAIIAFWNAPLDIPDHAERAVRAALQCQQKLEEMRPILQQKYGRQLLMRIGLNTGFAVAGNMGSSSRFDYTVLGDAVNLAARLEGANKQFGTYTMMSQSTLKHLGDEFRYRELARLTVVGRSEPVTVYEPLSPNAREGEGEGNFSFTAGLNLFYKGDFQNAGAEFEKTAESDPAAGQYLEQCKKLLIDPPENWDGVWKLVSK